MTKSMLSAKLRFVPYNRFKKVVWHVVSKHRNKPIDDIKRIKNLDDSEVEAVLNYFNRELIDFDEINI
ncbi:hypothetical protein [Tenacibaculum piscium]|uniref:hypothetical protein n=2 Tax=Tenacibaculum piscium TaxID=1458515 RepID=UPI001F31CD26|nr:hypothetical protein [Tenacibaculum piscium]